MPYVSERDAKTLFNRSTIYIVLLCKGAPWWCRLGCEHDTLWLLLLQPHAGEQPILPTCTPNSSVDKTCQHLIKAKCKSPWLIHFLYQEVSSRYLIVNFHGTERLLWGLVTRKGPVRKASDIHKKFNHIELVLIFLSHQIRGVCWPPAAHYSS